MSLNARLLVATAAFATAAVPATLIAYAATHGWSPLQRVDQSAGTAMHLWSERTPGAVSTFDTISIVLGPWVLRAVSFGIVVALVVRRQRRLALWFGTTVVAAGLLGVVLKSAVGRSRPVLPDPVTHAPGFSFPSGHALNSLVFFGALVLLVLPLLPRRWRPWLWASAISVVVLVGAARVGLGVHFVSDILGGWIIGAGLLVVTTVTFESWRRDVGKPVPDVLVEGISPEGSVAAVTPD